jgi:hypothetical protein
MSAVENKMNTEMNTEMTTTINVPAVKGGKKVIKTKKTETKPASKIVVEDEEEVVELVAEKVDEEVVVEKVEEDTSVEIELNGTKVVITDDENDELSALLKQQEHIARQIQLVKNSKDVKKNVSEYRKVLVENRTKKIQSLRNSIAEIQNEIKKVEAESKCLEDLQDEELANAIVGNAELEAELGLVAKVSKSIAKADKVEGTIKRGKIINKTMKPAERWALIDVGTQFRAKSGECIRYYKKTADGVVECSKDGKTIQGSPVYAGNQEAANAFKVVANIPYSISGWEFLQLYNKATDKTKSLKKWDGDVEYLKW